MKRFDMDNRTCSLSDCDKPLKRAGYCYGHYMKTWRYGTPTPKFASRAADLIGQRFGTLVVVDRVEQHWHCVCDCGETRKVATGDLNRTGGSATCGNRTEHYRRDDAGYTAAHERCRSDRGRVNLHDCIGCGRTAQHWSYNHDDPDERQALGLSANPVAYSLKPEHYSPRCVSCHKRFDLDRLDAHQVA